MTTPPGQFGDCCQDLCDAMQVPNSFFRVEGNGVLYLSVGYAPAEGGQIGFFDQAVIHCPFCGAPLQSREDIAAKAR